MSSPTEKSEEASQLRAFLPTAAVPHDWSQSVETCLRDAGWTLVRLRAGGGYGLGYRLNTLETTVDVDPEFVSADAPTRSHPPTPWEIDHMDRVLGGWLRRVENVTVRRALAYRMLYDVEADRHLMSLKMISRRLGCSPPAVQHWYQRGLRELDASLRADRAEILITLLYVYRRTALYST